MYMTIFLGNIFKILKGEFLAEIYSLTLSEYDFHAHWTEGKTHFGELKSPNTESDRKIFS